MSKWFQWMILASLTGRPVLSAVLLLVFWWGVDRFTLGLLPDPFRFVQRLLRANRLQRELLNNPHDRQARRELAELWVGQGRYARAVEVLRPNLQAGDEDAATLFAMGVACMGAGHHEQGLVFLDHVEETSPGFRIGEVHLAKGRWLLAKGDAAQAVEALRRFITLRTGTIEGRVRLAKALQRTGDDASAALMYEQAWKEYVTAPRFQRRTERWWAWRARPTRPLSYLALALAVGLLFARFGAPQLAAAAGSLNRSAPYGYGHPSAQRTTADFPDDDAP